jgi:hypothetical protein
MGLFLLVLVLLGVSVAVTVYVHREEQWPLLTVGVLAVCLLITTGVSTWLWAVTYRHEHWATCHVTGKDRGKDNGSYRVYTTDCDTLGVEDSVFRMQFDASNRWQKIDQNGGTYQFLIVGSRIPVWSQFANILDVRPAPAG